MEIKEISKENMDSVKELAATNIKISEAKNVLFKMQENERNFLIEREKKALRAVEGVLDDSKELLAKIRENHEEVHQFCQTIDSFVQFLSESHGKFQELLEDFKSKEDAWDKDFAIRHAEYTEIKKGLDVDKTIIANDKETIKKAFENIEKEKSVIESRQQQIKVALKVLDKKSKQ